MPIHVAAAAIIDPRGRVLIGRRADHRHQGGLWEFPGGKVEPGESVEQALARELKEELDILPLASEPLIRIHHQYAEREVLLDFFRVTRYQGEASGREGQPLRWLRPQEMRAEEFPAADRPVITALRLPDRYLITDGSTAHADDFLGRLKLALDKGLGIIQLRAHPLGDADYRRLLDEAREICSGYNARLLVNRPQATLDWLGLSDGIHLSARQLMALDARPAGEALIGASCHSLAELEQAERLQLDYLLLSPVLPTATHPGLACLGWSRFRDWVDRVNLPVYALGGMQPSQLQTAKRAGAQGIAAIRAFWPD
jgi:8-oxo-dGTP diphosphatase